MIFVVLLGLVSPYVGPCNGGPSGSAGRLVICFATQSPATRTLVTAKDRILKPHIVKYSKIALKRQLVKFLEKRPIFIVGIKTYVQQSITWWIRYQSKAVDFCKNIFIMDVSSVSCCFSVPNSTKCWNRPLLKCGSGKYPTAKTLVNKLGRSWDTDRDAVKVIAQCVRMRVNLGRGEHQLVAAERSQPRGAFPLTLSSTASHAGWKRVIPLNPCKVRGFFKAAHI